MDILAQVTESESIVNGEIPAGFLFASIKNTGSVTALVNNVSLPPGEAKSYPFVGKGYAAVPYTTNGTSLRIMVIV